MAIHGRERLRVIKALAEETEYRGGSALTVRKSFNGWGSYPPDRRPDTRPGYEGYTVSVYPCTQGVRTWVYSYATPIAWVLDDGSVVIPEHSYSTTTSHHQGLARMYLANLRNADPWIERL